MASFKIFFHLALLACISATPCKANIQWSPCEAGEFNTTLPLLCGTLAVPLDYTDPHSDLTIDLEILKIPAVVQPSYGSIQLNFGGPGIEGRSSLAARGRVFQQLSGGFYDLLAFDPRATGKTVPFVCTDEPYYIGQIANEFRSGKQSDTALQRLWARGKVDANICGRYSNANDTAELVGTAFTARDFMSVVDALSEDGLLRYWGISYGSVLGATLAAMFPERIDKLIIDGVLNPHEYYNAHADFEQLTDSDKALSFFFETCVEAGPEKCALAAQNKTAAALEQDMWDFLDSVRESPIAAGTFIVDLIGLKSYIAESLKLPLTSWPRLAEFLTVLVYGSEDQQGPMFERVLSAQFYETEEFSLGLIPSFWAIRCGDRTVREESFEAIAPVFEQLSNTSRILGDVVHSTTPHCAQWPWRAKEVYHGDFQVKTKNPILVISNSIDSHTPLVSALNVSSGFEGSGFLEVNGTGHTLFAVPSACLLKHTANYWVNGTLPEPGALCDTARPFDTYTWDDVFEEVGTLGGFESRKV